jgi:hypothetical protein
LKLGIGAALKDGVAAGALDPSLPIELKSWVNVPGVFAFAAGGSLKLGVGAELNEGVAAGLLDPSSPSALNN